MRLWFLVHVRRDVLLFLWGLVRRLAVINDWLCRLLVVFYARVRRVVICEVRRLAFRIRFVVGVQSNALSHAPRLSSGFAACGPLARFHVRALRIDVTHRVSGTVVCLGHVAMSNFPSRFRSDSVSNDVCVYPQVDQGIRAKVGLHHSVGQVSAHSVAKDNLAGIFVKGELGNQGAFRRLIVILTRVRRVVGEFKLGVRSFKRCVRLLDNVCSGLNVNRIRGFFVAIHASMSYLAGDQEGQIDLRGRTMRIVVALLGVLGCPRNIVRATKGCVVLHLWAAIFCSRFLF